MSMTFYPNFKAWECTYCFYHVLDVLIFNHVRQRKFPYWTATSFLPLCYSSRCIPRVHQCTLMLLVANLENRNYAKNLKNDWNPGIWVLIWEYSARAIQWILTWHGLDGFQKSLRPCALDKSSPSIGRVNTAVQPALG